MNNFYHKVAVASICTALSFTLVTNKEAKAATITLRNITSFYAVDTNNDGLGDGSYGNIYTIPVGKSSKLYPQWEGMPLPEFRALYEFKIASLSLTSNTIITQAIFRTTVDSWFSNVGYLTLGSWGYKRNGRGYNPEGNDADYFQAGTYLNQPQRLLSAPSFLNINVTPFVNELASNNDVFAGFNIRANEYSAGTLSGEASLIITTADVAEPVPEPTTIFGSVIALGVGGWLKRKKSSQQNKTKRIS